jgi:hypothetical protein
MNRLDGQVWICEVQSTIEAKGGGGGTTVVAPGPTEEELALTRQQTEILKQQTDILQSQFAQQELLAPFLFEEAGIIPDVDPDTGEILGFEIDPEREALNVRQRELETAFLERSEQALAGELPVNPALLRDLDIQEEALREGLRKQLGPGFDISSPGIEALSRFGESKDVLLEGARRGDLTLAEQLGGARELGREGDTAAFLQQLSGINQAGANFAGAFGQNAAGFGAPLSFFERQRDQQFQAAIFNAQNQARSGGGGGLFGNLFGSAAGGLFGGIGGGIGRSFGSSLFGASAGGGGSAASAAAAGGILGSSREIKNFVSELDASEVLELVQGLDVEAWNYKEDQAHETHIGPYAEDFQLATGLGDGKTIDTRDLVGILMLAVQALATKQEIANG